MGGGSSVVSEFCSAFLCFSLCFAFWVPDRGYALLFLGVLVGPCCVLSLGLGFRVYCLLVCWFDGSVG